MGEETQGHEKKSAGLSLGLPEVAQDIAAHRGPVVGGGRAFHLRGRQAQAELCPKELRRAGAELGLQGPQGHGTRTGLKRMCQDCIASLTYVPGVLKGTVFSFFV